MDCSHNFMNKSIKRHILWIHKKVCHHNPKTKPCYRVWCKSMCLGLDISDTQPNEEMVLLLCIKHV